MRIFALTTCFLAITLGLSAKTGVPDKNSVTLTPEQLTTLIKAAIAAGVVGSSAAAAAAPGAVAGATVAAGAAGAGATVAAGAAGAGAAGATGAKGSSIVCFTPYSAPICAVIAAAGWWFFNPTVGAGFRSDQFLCCEGLSGSCKLQEGYLIDTCSRWSYTLYSLPQTYSYTTVNIPAKTLDGKTVTFDVKGLNIVRINWTFEAAEWFGQEYRKGSDLFKNAYDQFLPLCMQEYASTQTRDSLVQQGKGHTLSDPLLHCIDVGLNALRFPYKRDGSFRTTVSV